ncbi:hypothetical protein SEUCBS140593_002787 [Sporothrix eucalyptigena]|uniref:Glycoside hydrolase family 42 N-terminal domain-containing protein n=1 Tax=Sporothrix eucalyptigena TaxID=1812306 RepID=A0ABP0B9J3_9PEZI
MASLSSTGKYPSHPHLRNHSTWLSTGRANINTLLGSVTWEAIEPREQGVFDFAGLDRVVLDARQHGLRLVLLWFGSYKNCMSTYVPRWVKTDHERFPRCQVGQADGTRRTVEMVSPFSREVREADARAFAELMAHIRAIDERHGTVLMVQVKNEPGLLGDSRDRSAVADDGFRKPIPELLLKHLSTSTTQPAFRERFANIPDGGCHSWKDVFGQGTAANEAFMAYHMSTFVSEVAAAGRQVYPLPMFVNAWLNADRTSYGASLEKGEGEGGADAAAGAVSRAYSAGRYPSGGPVPHMLDIWRYSCADVLDFFSPDIYAGDYALCLQDYQSAHASNVLFVPEQRRDAYGCRRLWLAYASRALGCSPFGIDTADLGVVGREYRLLANIQHLLLTTRAEDRLGFFFDDADQPVAQ